MSKSFVRGLLVLRMIPHHPRGITTRQIWQRLIDDHGIDVEIRTIQHDISHIADIHPLSTLEHESPPQYCWPQGAQVELVPGHDDDSALTWNLLEQYLEPLLPEAMNRRAQPIFDVATRYLESQGRERINNWSNRVRMIPRAFSLQTPHIDGEVQRAVYQALWVGEALSVTYLSRGADEPKELVLHPQALIVREGVFYLIAQVEGYKDLRQFALHRMQAAESTHRDADQLPDFDLDDYLEKGAFSYPQGGQIDLVVKCDAEVAKHLFETPLTPEQTTEVLHDGRVEIRASVLDSQQLRWWIQGFGAHMEVVAPDHLRDHFKAVSQQLSECYQD